MFYSTLGILFIIAKYVKLLLLGSLKFHRGKRQQDFRTMFNVEHYCKCNEYSFWHKANFWVSGLSLSVGYDFSSYLSKIKFMIIF